MSAAVAPGGPDDLPRDGAPLTGDIWSIDFSDPLADASDNLFSSEIEDFEVSAWDVDSAQIWGEEQTDDGAADDGGVVGADLPI